MQSELEKRMDQMQEQIKNLQKDIINIANILKVMEEKNGLI